MRASVFSLGKNDCRGCVYFGTIQKMMRVVNWRRCRFMAFDSCVQGELPMPEVHKACEGANFSAIFVGALRSFRARRSPGRESRLRKMRIC
jgi:hypothetical protein